MVKFFHCAGMLPVLLFVASVTDAGAQARVVFSAGTKASNEALCVRQASALRSARTGTDGALLLRAATQCPDTGAALLAEMWRSRPADTTYLNLLREHSRTLNDRRIASALMSIIEDVTAGLPLRTRALEAMASQLSPRLGYKAGTFTDVPLVDPSPPHRVIGSTKVISGTQIWVQSSYVAGREVMDVSTRATFETILKRLAESDSTLSTHLKGALSLVATYRD